MERSDLHVHSLFSDGADTPEAMVLAAIEKGLSAIGFSDHSYTVFDERYCMKKDALQAYRTEIGRLKEKYGERIRVLCGIEQDYYADVPAEGFDYVIGSVHYMKFGGDYVPVDQAPGALREAAEKYCGGDPYLLAETYFETVSDVVRKTGCTIIGHFDLIAKFNETSRLFDERYPRYAAARQKAADALLKTGVPFEINFGAIYRGNRSVPYPDAEMRAYIRERGGSFVLSGDAHCTDAIAFGFDPFLRGEAE